MMRRLSQQTSRRQGGESRRTAAVQRQCAQPDQASTLALAAQQAIVAEIEAERALVAANRELIARFEKKIQATLARVWGEDVPSPAEA
jgi:hypothetical protein